MDERIQVEVAIKQIEFARQNTLFVLQDIDPSDWFIRPAGAPTHVAWQVGHLAMAQYGLTMLRVRGKEPEDEQLISKDFFRCFKKGSQPGEQSEFPSAAEIRATLDRVHAQALKELAGYKDADLSEPVPEPYAVYPTKLGSLLFCPLHEMLHGGQLGLLRRLLGKSPLR